MGVCFNTGLLIAQETLFKSTVAEEAHFTIEGLVRERETFTPIRHARVDVQGGASVTTDRFGEFKVKAKKGDRLTVSHPSFNTVFYMVYGNDKIIIDVVAASPSANFVDDQQQALAFERGLDSARAYKKQDVEKSLRYATEALAKSNSKAQNAMAYEVIADIYFEWQQYDLAISNYKISLQSRGLANVELKLAQAYERNKNFEQSIEGFKALMNQTLSTWETIALFEGLGDAYLGKKDYTKAVNTYKSGLDIAKKHLVSPKVTDLNSKIAKAYTQSGQIEKAELFFDNALELASKENKKRALEEKITVADFQHTNHAFEAEIKLRKEALQNIRDIETDSVIDNKSALTPQKQNYKIGNAYFLKKDYDSAVSYLEKSIKEADEKADLVIKKDAKRKLSEVYSQAGNDEKALEAYKEYTEVVEALYVKKEQEIVQAAKFSRDIANKQNRIASLEKDRELSESKYQLTSERNKRQQLVIYSLIGGVMLLMVLAYFMYKYIKQQRLANNLLALKSLRSQMNPHFIFNALNSVNSFIALNDERTANKYLTDFSFLMRAVLENSEADFIPLKKEMELLQLYTKLEHFRFKDQFDYEILVAPEITVEDYQIPPMLLQPFIENAVWHGLRYKTQKGMLRITLEQLGKNELQIIIADNGIGREKSKALKTKHQEKHNSKGMSNIKKRVEILNKMHKDKVDVYIDDLDRLQEDVGTKVTVILKKD
ncbi:histidine kinase [Mangrovimonas yunxiaonensis]|uniref:Histidine kinase n=2 Tax=Mangrovimonas yunxiaonensis TaxID=1197477 RepID=A0A084TMB8_9FLAO|nr:histidine kinase [Mangrovimonas yunxiaonensis]GGH41394.1 hypothetical protein GCM10011364_12170 [Mangrovimonas yunxiaonensis]